MKDEQEKFEMREVAIRPFLVEKLKEHEQVHNNTSISHMLNRMQHYEKLTVEVDDEKCTLQFGDQ